MANFDDYVAKQMPPACEKFPVWKAFHSEYQRGKSFVHETRIEYRARKSCKCNQCNETAYCFNQDLIEGIVVTNWNELQDGKYYKPVVVNITNDWETGYADYWEWELVEVEV